jgi:hypothetical protein
MIQVLVVGGLWVVEKVLEKVLENVGDAGWINEVEEAHGCDGSAE